MSVIHSLLYLQYRPVIHVTSVVNLVINIIVIYQQPTHIFIQDANHLPNFYLTLQELKRQYLRVSPVVILNSSSSLAYVGRMFL